MQELWNLIEAGLGLTFDSHELYFWQMALRTVVVYVAAVFLIRISEKRFLSKNTVFDVILGIVFGSIISRAITGQSAFFPTLGAAVVVVLMHWLFAVIGFHYDSFGVLIKGNAHVLVKDGEIQWDAMQHSHIGERDLMSALRRQGSVTSVEEVQEARLERSGEISVIKKD
ncbi:MAG: YetF domain-containing protein [Litorilinea sp.]